MVVILAMTQGIKAAWACIPSFGYSSIALEVIRDEPIRILSAGEKFLYVLPGFDVFSVELWYINVKGFGSKEENCSKNDISICHLYIFIKYNIALCHLYLVKVTTVVKTSSYCICAKFRISYLLLWG